MNSLRHLRCVCFFTIASALADDAMPAKYVTAKEILAMPATTATVDKRLSDFAKSFTTADGRVFVLGDAAGAQEVWHFVATLKEGQPCKLPEAFANYLAAPHFETAEEIIAMAPRTATLATRTPCSAHFNVDAKEGKGFDVGGPGSGAEISHFLWTLKSGAEYKFPGAFLDFRASPTYATAKDIAAMAPRTATLVAVFDGYCYFRTADGKGFAVGDREAKVGENREVDRFLRTLEEEKAYKFPEVFQEFQKGNKKP